MKTFANDLIMRAARGEHTERTPIWLMRQAGRTDPEYMALRKNCGLALHDLFRHADLAAEISLLPKRIGVDAIIYFQDILTPLGPMGAEFKFVPGPVIPEPICTARQIDELRLYDVAAELPFIPETFRKVYAALDGEMPVLGFAGAPLTLAVFLVEGKSFGQHSEALTRVIAEESKALRALLDKLTTMTIDYLKLQIEAGAAAVQLFESAAFLLSVDQYREWALPYQQQILDAVRGLVPTILFARDWEDIPSLMAAGADIVSLSDRVSIEDFRAQAGVDARVQGNLSNTLLCSGDVAEIEKQTMACIREGGHRGHIFNLGHGLLSETPFDRVTALVKRVKETRIAGAN